MIIAVIDIILFILIYGSMIVFPALFCVHMQVAWENHIDSYFISAYQSVNLTSACPDVGTISIGV